MKREQELAVKALANVLKSRMSAVQVEPPVAADPLTQALHTAINTTLGSTIKQSLNGAVNDEFMAALAKLVPVEVTNRFEMEPLMAAIEQIVQQVASRPVQVAVDLPNLNQTMERIEQVLHAYEQTMDRHNQLMERLVEKLPKELIVNVMEQPKRTKVIVRDEEGNISRVEEQ
jgi:hypothetical protein